MAIEKRLDFAQNPSRTDLSCPRFFRRVGCIWSTIALFYASFGRTPVRIINRITEISPN